MASRYPGRGTYGYLLKRSHGTPLYPNHYYTLEEVLDTVEVQAAFDRVEQEEMGMIYYGQDYPQGSLFHEDDLAELAELATAAQQPAEHCHLRRPRLIW